MKIEGLTPLQIKICDKIYSMETEQQIYQWMDTLPRSIQFQAYVMIQMILHTYLDETDLGDMVEAQETIEYIRSL